MSRLFSKLVVILLIALIGMPFQYGAASDAIKSAGESAHLRHLSDLAKDTLVFSSDTDSTQDRNGSDAGENHTVQSCYSGICASCIPAIVPKFVRATNYIFVLFSQHRENSFVDNVPSTLFRPPKA